MSVIQSNQLRIRYTVAFCIVALVMAISGYIGNQLIKEREQISIVVSGKINPALSDVINADRDLYQARVAEIALLNSPELLAGKRSEYEENSQQAYDRINDYRRLLEDYPDIIRKTSGFEAAYSAWRTSSMKVFAQVRNDNFELAKSISNGESLAGFNALRKILDTAEIEADQLNRSVISNEKESLERRQTFVNFILSSSILLTLVLGIFAPSSMSKALSELRKELKQLNSGDGNLARRIRSKRYDEIGLVSLEVDELLDSLTALIRIIVTQSASTIDHVKQLDSSAELACRSSKSQVESIEGIVDAVSRLSEIIREVAENAQLTATEIKEVTQLSETGKIITTETAAQIQHVADGVGKAAAAVKELSKSSDDITTVLDVIRGIAEQTNLLALNAAIEAARAGEQGRGFAVVADEVRSLASKTQQSTDDIQKMIETLQSGVRDATATIDSGLDSVQASVEKSSETLSALDNIVAAATRVSDASAQIASSTEQQKQVFDDVSRNLTQLSDLGRDAYTASSDCQNSAKTVSNITLELNESVARFKLP